MQKKSRIQHLDDAKKAIGYHKQYRNLDGISRYLLQQQTTLKKEMLIKPNDSVSIGTNYSGHDKYFGINKDHPLHPMSTRQDNRDFYPIRKLHMLNLINKPDTWLAGGAIRSCLDGKMPNDFDLFCKTKEAFQRNFELMLSSGMSNNFKCTYVCINTLRHNELVTKVNYDHLKNAREFMRDPYGTGDDDNMVPMTNLHMIQSIADDKPPIVKTNDHIDDGSIDVVSFTAINPLFKDFKIQIIHNPKSSNTIFELMQDFDFHICQFGFDGEYFYHSRSAGISWRGKTLSVNKVNYPVSILRRISKYGQHGYNMNSDVARSLFDKINKGEFKKDQLKGYID